MKETAVRYAGNNTEGQANGMALDPIPCLEQGG